MSRQHTKELLLWLLTVFTFFFVTVSAYKEEVLGITFFPAVPDTTKTLSSSDGPPDGCNSSRFKCLMGDEAVMDRQTGLIWARNAYVAGKKMSWHDAVTFCQNLRLGRQKGWRLPSREEMISLLDTSQSGPALPRGHPFRNVGTVGCTYWTATEQTDDSEIIWIIKINLGAVQQYLKTYGSYAWPVLDSN